MSLLTLLLVALRIVRRVNGASLDHAKDRHTLMGNRHVRLRGAVGNARVRSCRGIAGIWRRVRTATPWGGAGPMSTAWPDMGRRVRRGHPSGSFLFRAVL